ncbi:serine hydrolase [Nonomuraea typhae]|uniref:serine hydrolase n=1 Tax=Nonomuraea typhae TaxID=2603600 RepID=UPI0012FB0883|nr:serine hydrolase [Nonomuraea typhae]
MNLDSLFSPVRHALAALVTRQEADTRPAVHVFLLTCHAIVLRYCLGMFTEATARRLLGHLVNVALGGTRTHLLTRTWAGSARGEPPTGTVVSLVRAQAAASPGASAQARGEQVPNLRRVKGEVPLTPVQRRFTTIGGLDSQSVRLRWGEPPDPDRLRAALGRLIAHHDALRLRLRRTPGGWRQHVAERESADPLLDGPRPPGGRCVDPARGPMLRASLDGRDLTITVHRLAVDAASWDILLDDLATAYQGGPLPARTTPFRRWAERLAGHAAAPEFAAEAAYWRTPRPEPASFPVDHPGVTHADAATLVRTLDPAYTRALLAKEVHDLLVTALAQTVADHTGRPDVHLDLERDGRVPPFAGVDLSRTVGPFTVVHPFHVHLRDALDTDRCVKAVREVLRTTPCQGVGHGLAGGRAAAPISFAYEGVVPRGSGVFTRLTPESCPGRSHLIEVRAAVVDEVLQVTWAYSPAQYREETVSALAERFLDRVVALLIPSGRHTPRGRAFLDRFFPGIPATLLRMHRHRVPGAAVALVADGVVAEAWGEGLASATTGLPVRRDTVFCAGTAGEHVTALAVLRLAREGVADLDEDVNHYLSAPGVRPGLTLRVLLTRTPEGGKVVERVLCALTGRDLPGLMRELVFDPLGMRHSGYDARLPKAATGHDRRGRPLSGCPAGLWTSAEDLARVATEIQRAYAGTGVLLDRWAATQLLTPVPGTVHGLGTVVREADGVRWFGHTGTAPGYHCYSGVGLETGAGVVLMSNAESGMEFAFDLLVELGAGFHTWTER